MTARHILAKATFIGISLALFMPLASYSGEDETSSYPPAGIYSQLGEELKHPSSRSQATLNRINAVLALDGLNPITVKDDDICFLKFDVVDKDGKFTSYVPDNSLSANFKKDPQTPFYKSTGSSKCSYDAKTRMETCHMENNAKSYIVYPKAGNFNEYNYFEDYEQAYASSLKGDAEPAASYQVTCEAHRDTLMTLIAEGDNENPAQDQDVDKGMATFLRAFITDSRFREIVQKDTQ